MKTNLRFVSFGSIKRADDRSLTNALLREGLGSTPCIVQEKIHGANFSLWTDGVHVRAAKRTSFLKPRDRFFGFQAVLASHTPRILALFARLRAQQPSLRSLAVFGELYGGTYPHPDVPAHPDAVPVQRGVYYRPDVAFCGFDVLLNEKTWCPAHQLSALLTPHDIEAAQTLYEGPLSRCLCHPVERAPLHPARLGLPPIEGNITEGIVIRALEPLPGRGRLLLKKKSSAWQESDPRQARRKRKLTRKLSPQARGVLEEGLALICDNRLRSVLSKHGAVREGEERRLSRALYRDALDELGVVTMEELSRPERHRVDMALRQAADELIAEHFFAILEGGL